MVNKQRGEVFIALNGNEYRLRANLGALAEIEDALELDGLYELDQRLLKMKSKDVMALLQALSKGGGEEIPMEDLMDLEMADIEAAAEKIGAAISAGAPAGKKRKARKKKAGASTGK